MGAIAGQPPTVAPCGRLKNTFGGNVAGQATFSGASCCAKERGTSPFATSHSREQESWGQAARYAALSEAKEQGTIFRSGASCCAKRRGTSPRATQKSSAAQECEGGVPALRRVVQGCRNRVLVAQFSACLGDALPRLPGCVVLARERLGVREVRQHVPAVAGLPETKHLLLLR